MYIAGNYMLYAPSMEKHTNGFRVDDILGTATREMAPRKAACVVVRSSIIETPSIASKDLKFGIDKILSNTNSTRKETESPSPVSSTPSPICSLSCSACISRCCPMPSCRCNHIIEPYPVYPYQTTGFAKFATQPLISYPNSIYSTSELDMRMGITSMNSVAHHSHHTANGKRKRSWSRAVFSNLQRKGLEKRFQIQKYITKPDRRQLAATLGLTDAQVKVWFQNRRMKWRHSKEAREQFKTDKKPETTPNDTPTEITTTTTTKENPEQTI